MRKIIFINLILVLVCSTFMIFTETAKAGTGDYKLLLPLPGLSSETPSFAEYIEAAIRVGIILAALLAVTMIVIAGFLYITAGGNPGTLEKAKKFIWDALIGLLIAVGYYLILAAINPAILKGSIKIETKDHVKENRIEE